MRSIGGLILGVLAFLTTTAAAAPAIVVTAPSHGAVARPTLLVQASCTDPGPGGCQAFQVRIGNSTGPIVATGTSTIDQPVDLAAYDGQALSLWIGATDAGGAVTSTAVPVWVESSPVLTPVATVIGEVLDVDATRVLYLDAMGVARVRRRTDGTESTLGPVHGVRFGRLTSTGAIYASREGAPGCVAGESLYEWHGSGTGAVVEVDRACDAVTARWIIDGDWGARRDSPLDVTRRDLRVGVETAVRLPMTISRGHTAMTRFDVGPNGDVHALLQQPYSFPAWDHFRDRAGVQNVDALAADTSSTPPVALAADSVGWATALCSQYTGAPPTCAVYRCLAPGVGCGYAVSWVDVGIRDGIMLTGGWLYLRYNTGGFPAGTPVVGALGRIAPSTNPPSTMLVGGAGDTFEAVTTFGAATMLRSTGRAVLDVAGTLHPIGTNVGRGLFVGPDAYVAIGGTVFQVATPTGGSMRAAPDEAAASSGCQAGGDASGSIGLIAIAAIAIGRRRRRRGLLLIVLLAAGCPGGGAAPAVDAGAADASSIDAQDVDAQDVDAQLVDAQDVDAQLVDAQLVDAQLVDAQDVDAQDIDAHVIDAQDVDAQLVDAQLLDAQLVDAQLVDAQLVDAQAVDAQAVDAQALDASTDDTPVDAGPSGPGCTIDRSFDVGGAGLPAAEVAVVDTGVNLLMLFTDGPTGTLAPLRWTRVSYTGARVVPPQLLATAARRPQVTARDGFLQTAYLISSGWMQQRFVGGAPAAATTLATENLAGMVPGLGAGVRFVVYTTGTPSFGPTFAIWPPSVGGGPRSLDALAISRVSSHTDGTVVGTVTRARPLPGCADCTTLALMDFGHWGDGGTTITEPTLPAGRIATARALTHRGTTYLAWIESNADGTAPTGAIARYPLDVVTTIPDARALTMVATGNGVGVVGYQDATGAWLHRFTDDLAGFALGPACGLDVVPDQLVRIDGDTVLALDAAGHARIVTFTP